MPRVASGIAWEPCGWRAVPGRKLGATPCPNRPRIRGSGVAATYMAGTAYKRRNRAPSSSESRFPNGFRDGSLRTAVPGLDPPGGGRFLQHWDFQIEIYQRQREQRNSSFSEEAIF